MLLLVSPNREFGKELLQQGILNFRCLFDNALSIAKQYDVSGACLDGWEEPEKMTDVCEKLRFEYPEIPIFLFCKNPAEFSTRIDEFCTDPAEFLAKTVAFCQKFCHLEPVLQNFYLTVTPNPEETKFLGYKLPLSPTEHRILRLLFWKSPRPVSEAELLAVCFPEGTQSRKNLAVQISSLNKKASKISRIPPVRSVRSFGYELNTFK